MYQTIRRACEALSVVLPSRRPLEHEEAMVGSSGVDRRKGTDADDCGYAGATVYIAMVGGGGTDVWRWSSRLGNHVSLMCVADGRSDDTCVI